MCFNWAARLRLEVPIFAFFSKDAGFKVNEAPGNMLIAMGAASFLCILIGVYPGLLYTILPYPVDFVPYTLSHIVNKMQLLMFSVLAFILLLRVGIYPAEIRAINLDSDWFYRKGGRLFYGLTDRFFNGLNQTAEKLVVKKGVGSVANFAKNGPAHLASLIMAPIWLVTLDQEQRQTKRDLLYRNFSSGTMGLAIMAVFVSIFLGIVFVFSF